MKRSKETLQDAIFAVLGCSRDYTMVELFRP